MMDHDAIRRLKRRELIGDMVFCGAMVAAAVLAFSIVYIALKP